MPEHPLAQQDFVEVEGLVNEHLILYTVDESIVLKDLLEPADLRSKKVSQVQRTEAILELVKAEMGITVMARWAAIPYIRTGEVSATSLAPDKFLQRHVVMFKDNSLPQYLQDFIALLVSTPFEQATEKLPYSNLMPNLDGIIFKY